MLRILSTSALLTLSMALPAFAQCIDTRVTLRGDNSQAGFTVEIADDDAERAQGLMNRESMPRFSGMLFDFDAPQRAVFWMENTLIPLDMIFADATGTVTRIHENAIPRDRTPIPGGDNIQYVLEINGGRAAALGITVGSQIQHPAIDPELAAWPC